MTPPSTRPDLTRGRAYLLSDAVVPIVEPTTQLLAATSSLTAGQMREIWAPHFWLPRTRMRLEQKYGLVAEAKAGPVPKIRTFAELFEALTGHELVGGRVRETTLTT